MLISITRHEVNGLKFNDKAVCNVVQLTGRNKLCHSKGRIMGIRDNTIADRTPCLD